MIKRSPTGSTSWRVRSMPCPSGRPGVRQTEADKEKLKRIQVTLDQCWDLLRQRRARREFGHDPEAAVLRDEKTIKGYTG